MDAILRSDSASARASAARRGPSGRPRRGRRRPARLIRTPLRSRFLMGHAKRAERTRPRGPSARSSASPARASRRARRCAGGLRGTASRPRLRRRPWDGRSPAGSWTTARYADVLVRSRLAQGRGVQGIRAELASLGIEPPCEDGFAGGLSDDHDSESRARPRRCSSASPRAPRTCARPLTEGSCRRGSAPPVSTAAARIWHEGRDL